MSTTFVYHLFAARAYDSIGIKYLGGAVYFHLIKKAHLRRCVCCRSAQVTLEGLVELTLHSLPIGAKKTFLVLHLHRLRCHRCGALRQESREVAQRPQELHHGPGPLGRAVDPAHDFKGPRRACRPGLGNGKRPGQRRAASPHQAPSPAQRQDSDHR